MKDRNVEFVFIDTETGGIDPNKHSLLQVGVVLEGDEGECITREYDIRSFKYNVTPEALSINHIDLESLDSTGVSNKYMVNDLKEFITLHCKSKPVVVGHNVGFDIGFMKKAFSDLNEKYDDTFNYRNIDTMSLLWALWLKGKIPLSACSSSGAFEYFGIVNDKPHNALSDALATRELFYSILGYM